MISEADKNEMCRMRRLGFTLGLYRQGDRIFSFQRSKRDRVRGTTIGKQREG